MIIYLEGVDGSGKSTLTKAIATRLEALISYNPNYKNMTVYPDAEATIPTQPWSKHRINKQDLMARLIIMAHDLDAIYILDRGPLSDILYRTFDAEKYQSVLTLSEFIYFWMAHSDLIVMIHCDSPQASRLMAARGDDNPMSLQYHQRLRYLYSMVMPLFNAQTYDVAESIIDKHHSVNFINRILTQVMEHRQQRKTQLTDASDTGR